MACPPTPKSPDTNRSWFLQLLGQVSGYGVFYDKEFFLIQGRKWYLLYSMFFNVNMNFPPTFKNLPPNYSRFSPKSSQRVGRSASWTFPLSRHATGRSISPHITARGIPFCVCWRLFVDMIPSWDSPLHLIGYLLILMLRQMRLQQCVDMW